MEKRYQVFISSTSKDLQNARQEVSQALLRSDCFPAQMELWPATDEEQFEFIKQIIRQCDYYIVISAGMYGSVHPDTGISYTEMEFDYAQEVGIPTIRLLHRDPFRLLKGSQIENTDEAKRKLKAFRQKLLDGKLCAFWETPTDLGREVVLSLNDIKRRKPRDGWVKASQIASSDALIEIADLRRKLSELELRRVKEIAPTNVAGVIERLVGSIALTRCDLDQRKNVRESADYGTPKISFHVTKYLITTDVSKVEARLIAPNLLYGLLFQNDASDAIRRGFASKETDDSGNPLFVMDCGQTDDLEDMFMTLENEGIITAGEKTNHPSIFRYSYVESYKWSLTDVGREWITANKPRLGTDLVARLLG